MSGVRVAVAGATGAVGREMLDVLERREFPVRELVLLASSRSKGRRLEFRGEEIEVGVLAPGSFRGVDLALFSAGGSTAKEFAPHAVDAGAVVVDNSSAFRYEPNVPLVVPEVNADALGSHPGIVANPNCSTIIMLVAIAPIHRLSPLERVFAATYQAASGAGAAGMEALRREAAGEGAADGAKCADSPFPHRLSGNVVPRIDTLQETGYTREEMKMVWETRKILGCPELPVSATCVRVPVERAHSEAIHLTTREPLSVDDVRAALKAAPGVTLEDDPAADVYPTPLAVSGADDVFVGRIRRHPDDPRTFDLWVVGDQVRKGAALNAVQIAEALFC